MHKTTQNDRLELVMKLARNVDIFSTHLPEAQNLEGDGWSAGVCGITFEIFNSALITKKRKEAVDEVINLFDSKKVSNNFVKIETLLASVLSQYTLIIC